jgi:hypothetical protein
MLYMLFEVICIYIYETLVSVYVYAIHNDLSVYETPISCILYDIVLHAMRYAAALRDTSRGRRLLPGTNEM